ncbi:MAG: DUF1805 domain-containing protein [Planctomycetota bacterium]
MQGESDQPLITTDLSNYRVLDHAFNRPLLVISGRRGSLCCGYIALDVLERNGDAAAIVRKVDTPDAMLAATVSAVTSAAEALGVVVGMSGAEALKHFEPEAA